MFCRSSINCPVQCGILPQTTAKARGNVSSSSSVKKTQKKSASTTPKPKKTVDKKALENNVNKEKLDNKSK